MGEDPLGLDPETMRQLGYQTVDLLVDRLAGLGDEPVLRRRTPGELARRLGGPPPAGPERFEDLLEQLFTDVLPFISRNDHPGFLAYVPGCGTWPGVLGDLIASACNIEASSWVQAAGPSQVELVVLDWFKEWIGFPQEAAGVLVSGGSAANLTALACAREALLGAMSDQVVGYLSDQAHSSMARAARVLGFRPDQVRVLPVDDGYRMRPAALAAAMDADLRAGRRPLFVAASAGSTSTGAVDPLPELAALCRERGVWLHVDAAYGGFAALTERGRRWLAGIELADSVTLDPHKWLYQPFECGCLLVREGQRLHGAFRIQPAYLEDTQPAQLEVNFSDLGVQLSRTSRALKLWLSLRYFGVDAFRAAIDRCIDLARLAQARIEASSQLELLTPAKLGVVCFRRRLEGADEDRLERLNRSLCEGLAASGQGLVSSTRLRGRFALRMCVLNHTSGARDVERVLDWFERAPLPAPAAEPPALPLGHERDPPVATSWPNRRLGAGTLDLDGLRRLPLFQPLGDAELEWIAGLAGVRAVPAGEVIVEQWEATREFYVVLEGTAVVRTTERQLDDIGPGDFFGEIAALDWGASFGYARLATVTATSPMRLLVLASADLLLLMNELPQVSAQVSGAMRDRLPGL
jgi:glutamate/tyrosine decarboxylase-like PLP-dependent enzyme